MHGASRFDDRLGNDATAAALRFALIPGLLPGIIAIPMRTRLSGWMPLEKRIRIRVGRDRTE